MTITATSVARDYTPAAVRRRYVKYDGGGVYSFCEVGDDRHFDLRQGVVTVDELSPNVAIAAGMRRAEGVWPFYVEWPLP